MPFFVFMEARPPARVLVVDDDDAIATLIGGALEHDGYVVASVRDGLQALSQLSGDASYDVVVLDLSLPLMHGRDVYREIRSRSPELADRIVFITAASKAEDLDFLGTVANRRLTKPFRLAAVREAVARVAQAA